MIQYNSQQAFVINNTKSYPAGYIEEFNKIRRLMNKDRLGIMSEQLFKILTNKYPAEYRFLLLEKEHQNSLPLADKEKTVINSEEVFGNEDLNRALIEKEKEVYEKWIFNYGRP
jgi:hypothetical protein